MNTSTIIKKTSILSCLGLVLLIPAAPAQAGAISISYQSSHSGRHYSGRHHSGRFQHRHTRQPYGYVDLALPFGAVTLRVGGQIYHYHEGFYYRRYGHGYTRVPAPYGACVSRLPHGFRNVYHRGKRYYVANGVYYDQTPQGYVVIVPPSEEVISMAGPAKAAGQRSFTVNVPNTAGGYTAVVLTEKDSGYIGPQGEYYPEFPQIEQLKVMYGS